MIISTEEWIKFREDGQKFALEKLEEIFPKLINDIMNPLLNYRYKITDTELQNIDNNFVGGAR